MPHLPFRGGFRMLTEHCHSTRPLTRKRYTPLLPIWSHPSGRQGDFLARSAQLYQEAVISTASVSTKMVIDVDYEVESLFYFVHTQPPWLFPYRRSSQYAEFGRRSNTSSQNCL